MGERAPLSPSHLEIEMWNARVLAPALLSFALAACGGNESPPATPSPRPEEVDSTREGGHEQTRPARSTLPRTTVIETLVVFPQAPDHPQRMIATFSGNERARLWFGTLAKESLERRLIYRGDSGLFGIESRSSESREVPAEEAPQLIAQLELRRAAFLWPEGFEWSEEGTSYVTPLASGGLIRAQFAETVSGNAETDPANPIAFRSELAENAAPAERYADLVWSDAKRLTALRLYVGEQAIWDETLETYDVRARFVSSYFVPADRRSGSSGLGEAMVEGALRVELPRRPLLRAPIGAILRESETAPQNLAAARQLCDERMQEWKLPLEPGYAIEFDGATNQPTALLFWPAGSETESLPPGVEKGLRPPQSAVALLLTRQEVSDVAQSLPQLRAQFPEEAQPKAHYEVHFGGGDAELGDDRAQLVWAYEDA